MPFPLPIGARVREIESERTSNWTRIDVGRTGRVVGYKVHSFREEHGPRVLILVVRDEPRKWDSMPGYPIHASACQLELIEET